MSGTRTRHVQRNVVPVTFGGDICEYANKNRLTKSQAKTIAKRDARHSGKNTSAYKCPSCKGWHVGWKRRYA